VHKLQLLQLEFYHLLMQHMEYLMIKVFEFDQVLMNEEVIQQMLFLHQEQQVIDNIMIYHRLLIKIKLKKLGKVVVLTCWHKNKKMKTSFKCTINSFLLI
jgi:hypothetical protein